MELMRHDITFPLYVEVDEIYNLACPASPIHYQYDPVQTTKTSVMVQSTCWAWPSVSARRFFRRPRAIMVTPRSTRKLNILGQRQSDRLPVLL